MNRVQEMTKELIAAIEDSPECIGYRKAKEEIMKYPILKSKADEFRKRNYEILKAQKDILEKTEKLQQEYAEVMENPYIREYLKAENAFRRLLQQIDWQIIGELGFQTEFENTSEQDGTTEKAE